VGVVQVVWGNGGAHEFIFAPETYGQPSQASEVFRCIFGSRLALVFGEDHVQNPVQKSKIFEI
jgi:hypothetical protein